MCPFMLELDLLSECTGSLKLKRERAREEGRKGGREGRREKKKRK